MIGTHQVTTLPDVPPLSESKRPNRWGPKRPVHHFGTVRPQLHATQEIHVIHDSTGVHPQKPDTPWTKRVHQASTAQPVDLAKLRQEIT